LPENTTELASEMLSFFEKLDRDKVGKRERKKERLGEGFLGASTHKTNFSGCVPMYISGHSSLEGKHNLKKSYKDIIHITVTMIRIFRLVLPYNHVTAHICIDTTTHKQNFKQ
jgi:hypothetical protein